MFILLVLLFMAPLFQPLPKVSVAIKALCTKTCVTRSRKMSHTLSGNLKCYIWMQTLLELYVWLQSCDSQNHIKQNNWDAFFSLFQYLKSNICDIRLIEHVTYVMWSSKMSLNSKKWKVSFLFHCMPQHQSNITLKSP